jgi:hypothetical protein
MRLFERLDAYFCLMRFALGSTKMRRHPSRLLWVTVKGFIWLVVKGNVL